ncbi:MAG: sugar ABC transporter ATP-binding protein [Clostridiales bacterium]|nr:sugar ABC transporter ATP-binding protein [Clostridiales bacterium]
MNLIELRDIHKSFYGVEVLHGVNFILRPGTVHGLMGENGAGKSTLMKVIAGVHAADSGKILMDGKEVEIASPAKAREMGIAMIHQELSSELEMSVAENIFLGREPGKYGMVDYRQLYRQTNELLQKLGIDLDPKAKMKRLRVADQQMVEIAKAISQDARVVIMDEPTSSITDKEVESLFEMIRSLKESGVGIIYISHKMDEIFQICDDLTVLRDGSYINTFKASEVDEATLIHNMVGHDLDVQFPKVDVPIGETILEVEHLSRQNEYEDISFELHRGEILGFVGLVGAGRTELMHSIFGMTRPDSGTIRLNGQEIQFRSPKEAIDHRIAYVTEDRKGEGLVLPMSVEKNITLVSLKDFVKSGFLQGKKEGDVVQEQVGALGIKVAKTSMSVKSLSGGNQQKVVLAKWMIAKPNILIFDEPTRGIDVGAKAEIYKIMCDYVSQGNAIIMVSSEMPEAMGMSDRIIVLSNHKCSGELKRQEFDQDAIAQMQFKFMQSKQGLEEES